jgi:hypothetical protein
LNVRGVCCEFERGRTRTRVASLAKGRKATLASIVAKARCQHPCKLGLERTHRRFQSNLWCDSMISLEDCVALSGLTEEQVLAIAEHEHLPEIAATALAQYLSKQEHGMEKIRDMIVHDIRQAQQRQDKAHTLTLLHVLHHFLKSHPEVCPPNHPWSQLY